MNRKKNVTGQASQDSMNTHGAGRQEGPVGGEQKKPLDALRSGLNQARPMNRPKNPGGQASSGSMNTFGQGFGGSQQQNRPSQSGNAPQQPTFQQTGTSSNGRVTRGGSSPLLLIVILAVLLLGGGGGLSGLFGGGGDSSTTAGTNSSSSSTASDLLGTLLGGTSDSDSSAYTGTTGTTGNTGTTGASQTGGTSSAASTILSQMLGGGWYANQTGAASTAQTTVAAASQNSASANYSKVNRSVAKGSRSKYTVLKGDGKDTFTVMVYMCGADLESRSAMGTKDLQEMLNAKFGGKVRVIVYTGGCTRWQNNLVSSQVNQIWQVKDNNLICLEKNMGNAVMTDPDTLSAFIQYCAKNFSANRYALILWDHGSGSVSGYGYDEKNPRSGSMSLAGLNTALQAGKVKFDFIGFDACLMATVENALMASKYADYLIASEEAEPGIGWYYTNWLTAIGENSSLPTLDIGKQIIDDFVSTCSSQCRGQQTTLSIVDLAELERTVPASLTAFSQSVTELISNQEYKTVSNARNGCREFASSARIDQIDLSDLCDKLGTEESAALAKVLRSAVKYNRINNISNAYGLSVYFPYQRVNKVDQAVSTYEAIGMDSSYADAIRAFASVEASGQAVSGGGSVIPSLFGGGYGDSSSADMIGELLSAFLGGGSGMDFFSGRSMSDAALQSYLTSNYLDAGQMKFVQENGKYVLSLPQDQWELITGADLNIFYANKDGYVDLGLDNVFEFDDQGRLVADTEGTWLAINQQPVAYYREDSTYESESSWRISGRVPALLNGNRVELLLVFDAENENGYVAGARSVYLNGETDTVAKEMTEIRAGDTLVFLADLYDFNQNYQDSYPLGNAITVGSEGLTVSDVYLPDASKAVLTYRFTDLYQQAYWVPVK